MNGARESSSPAILHPLESGEGSAIAALLGAHHRAHRGTDRRVAAQLVISQPLPLPSSPAA